MVYQCDRNSVTDGHASWTGSNRRRIWVISTESSVLVAWLVKPWTPMKLQGQTLLHGTPEQINEIREYLDGIMDDAGMENKKQKSVYRNRRFWHILILSQLELLQEFRKVTN